MLFTKSDECCSTASILGPLLPPLMPMIKEIASGSSHKLVLRGKSDEDIHWYVLWLPGLQVRTPNGQACAA